MATPQFQHLFTPFTVGSVTVRNRIVVPGHATLFMPADGLPTERMLHYWLAKARGGVGLIMTHVHNVMPRHTGAPPVALLHSCDGEHNGEPDVCRTGND